MSWATGANLYHYVSNRFTSPHTHLLSILETTHLSKNIVPIRQTSARVMPIAIVLESLAHFQLLFLMVNNFILQKFYFQFVCCNKSQWLWSRLPCGWSPYWMLPCVVVVHRLHNTDTECERVKFRCLWKKSLSNHSNIFAQIYNMNSV